ncbi:MAG TPA: ABC transporter permease [Phycisphaerales bacterium]|nr:ABC transporter permease [Phycisphaerales bacterium]
MSTLAASPAAVTPPLSKDPVTVHSGSRAGAADLLNSAALVADLWAHRGLIRQFAARDVQMRHKGTMLGMVWMVVSPLIQLAIYTFLFTVVFPSRWERLGGVGDTAEFLLMFWCGFVVYGIFSESAGRAPGLVLDRPNLVRKVVFPLQTLPVAALSSSLVFGAVGIALLLAGDLALRGELRWTVLLFPAVLVPLLLLTLGAGWFLAALGVYIRDTRQVVAVLLQMLFFVTPIFYEAERLPERYRWLIELNPFTPIIESARRTLLEGRLPEWGPLLVVTLLGIVAAQLGYAFFMKTRRGFPDVM